MVGKLGLDRYQAIFGAADYVFQKVYGVTPDVLGDYRELTFAKEEEIKIKLTGLHSRSN